MYKKCQKGIISIKKQHYWLYDICLDRKEALASLATIKWLHQQQLEGKTNSSQE